jgi:hypothetical protein
VTDDTGKVLSWLEWRAQKTGKTVEEIRESMRQRGALQDKSKSGFAALPKDKLRAISSRGGKGKRK